jgi:DNA-binding PucR family transcriptional regulator
MMAGGSLRDTNLIHTLWAYLQSGQNAASTAATLKIHRNTLLGRLNSLEEIFNIHFNCLEEKTRQILYFSCFIAENVQN